MSNTEHKTVDAALTPPFTFGQVIYIAEANACGRIAVPCPVCYGKRSVVLILGNGEHQPVDCDYCGKGYDRPTGTEWDYRPESRIIEGAVDGLTQDSWGRGWAVQVSGRTYRLSDGNVFANREDAEQRRVVLHAEAESQAQRNFESRFKAGRKRIAWTAGYHKRCIADLKRQLEWHEAKLMVGRYADSQPRKPEEKR